MFGLELARRGRTRSEDCQIRRGIFASDRALWEQLEKQLAYDDALRELRQEKETLDWMADDSLRAALYGRPELRAQIREYSCAQTERLYAPVPGRHLEALACRIEETLNSALERRAIAEAVRDRELEHKAVERLGLGIAANLRADNEFDTDSDARMHMSEELTSFNLKAPSDLDTISDARAHISGQETEVESDDELERSLELRLGLQANHEQLSRRFPCRVDDAVSEELEDRIGLSTAAVRSTRRMEKRLFLSRMDDEDITQMYIDINNDARIERELVERLGLSDNTLDTRVSAASTAGDKAPELSRVDLEREIEERLGLSSSYLHT